VHHFKDEPFKQTDDPQQKPILHLCLALSNLSIISKDERIKIEYDDDESTIKDKLKRMMS
jgi:hypothetical protein